MAPGTSKNGHEPAFRPGYEPALLVVCVLIICV